VCRRLCNWPHLEKTHLSAHKCGLPCGFNTRETAADDVDFVHNDSLLAAGFFASEAAASPPSVRKGSAFP
jgi:hypothetical protein